MAQETETAGDVTADQHIRKINIAWGCDYCERTHHSYPITEGE